VSSKFPSTGEHTSGADAGAGGRPKILVLGIGNFLMGDEGVGVHLAQQMEKMELPAGVDALDGGTGGFGLLGLFDEYDHVIVVDATMDGQPAGTLRLTRPRFASDFPRTLSVHDVGLKDMIEALYLTRAPEELPQIYLITISIEEIVPMTVALSPPVADAIDKAITFVKQLIDKIRKEGN